MIRAVLRGLAAMFLGTVATVLVLAGVVALNDNPLEPPPAKERRETSFQIEARQKPPPPPTPPPPPKRKPKAPAPPSALLTASLSGLSFGLDAFDGLGLDGAAAAGGAADDDVVMTGATVDDPPRPVSRSAPEYPARARSRAVEGFVEMSLLIGEDGVVRDVQVLEAEPPGVFDEAARDAVRRWKFQPAMYEGRAVAIRIQQTLRFALE